MPETSREKTRILLVDDNLGVLKLLGTLFTEQGLAVTLVTSAAKAKAALDSAVGEFDLVLSDIAMPGESGFDLLSWIKRDDSPHRDLPVLLTTSQLPDAESRLKGLSMGAVDYVVRSLDLRELVVRAAHAIESFKRVKALEMSLQDSENLAMVGRLLAASHHEIKNVAMLVNLAAEQAVKCFAAGGDKRGAEALQNLSQATELLADISKNVGNLLHPEASRTKLTNITELINKVVELVRIRVRPCRVDAKVLDRPIWAMVHPVRLKQVLINLILNASDSIQEMDSAAGGAIGIATQLQNDVCQIVVTDNGIGFNPPRVRTNFEAFATTKKLRGGQGLGLWLCETLMRNMGGRMLLQSEGFGQGAQAILTLNTAEAPAKDDFNIDEFISDGNV